MSIDDLEYRALTTLDELRQNKEQWDTLAMQGTPQSPMLSYAWIANHLTHFESAGSWTCYAAYRGGRLVAILPVVFDKTSTVLGRTVARAPFGDHLNISDILCEKGIGTAVLLGLLEFVFTTDRHLAYLELPRTPDSSQLLDLYGLNSGLLGLLVMRESYGYFLPIPEDYDAYERSLSRNFRSNLKKATNKLVKIGPGDFENLDDNTRTSTSLNRFAEIEKSGWKGRSRTAIGSSEDLTGFYSDVLRDLKDTGFLEWHFLRVEDADLAGHMAFRVRDKLILWKLAYNDAYSACGPGNQLLRELIKREGCEQDCSELDLTTDQAWYEKWNMHKRPYFHLRIYNRANAMGNLLLYGDRMRGTLQKNPWLRRMRRAMMRMKSGLRGKET